MKTVEYAEQDLHEMANIISKLSLADTFKLVKILDKEFGIRVVNGEHIVGDNCGPANCPTDMDDYDRVYKVYITNVGPSKLQVVKTIKDLTGLGLRKSKDIADAAAYVPSLVQECEKFQADHFAYNLREAGASVSII